MSEKDIRRCLRELESDSEEAFRHFYNLTYDRLYRIAFYYVKKEELAQEVVIEVFMNLWNKRKSLIEIDKLENYLFTMTKNAALDTLGKENRWDTVSADEVVLQEAGSDCSPEETLVCEELFARYVKALEQLPERCRQVFIALREEGKSYAQVAVEMSISEKTVDAQLQKALKLLKQMLL